MEETSDFGNLLQNKLDNVVNSIQNPEETDEEELLFQIHNIDELLITLNNLSESVQLGISTDDILILKQLDVAVDRIVVVIVVAVNVIVVVAVYTAVVAACNAVVVVIDCLGLAK